MPSNGNEDRRTKTIPRRRRPHSPCVAGLGRSKAWLRLLEKRAQLVFRELAKRLLSRSRALRRVACYACLFFSIHVACEDQAELILIVRRDVARWHDAPCRSIDVHLADRHSGNLHFVVDARRIENPILRRCVRIDQRCVVVCFYEFHECARKRRLLECPEATVCFSVMRLARTQSLEI